MQDLIKETEDQPKWRRKPERRPDDILDGALREFRARGFAAARIEDIAKHAGLSKGTVYLYFSSKEEMLKELVKRTVVPLAENMKNMATILSSEAENKSAEQILRAMLNVLSSRLDDEKVQSMPLLIISEAGNFPELVNFYRDEVINMALGALEMVINKGIRTGEFRPVKTYHAIRSLIGTFIMQVIWNGVFARKGDPKISMGKLMDDHLDIYLNGIKVSKEPK